MTLLRTFIFLLLFTAACGLCTSTGFANEQPPGAESGQSAQQLNNSIDEVITRPEFSWRLPREAIESTSRSSVLVDFLDEVRALIKKTGKRFQKYIKRFAEWMEDIFGHRTRKTKTDTSSGINWQMIPRILLIVLLTAAACAVGIVIIRLIRKRRLLQKEATPQVLFTAPDLKEENITADQLETDAWLKLADEMKSKGEYRLATRALFLAGLAHMAEQHYISIARFKSNREYNRELIRRARDRQPLLDTFWQCILFFESAWYGIHPVTPENLSDYNANITRIIHDY